MLETWLTVKKKLHELLQSNLASDNELIRLLFSTGSRDREAVWLIANYIWKVWDTIFIRKEEINSDEFFGFLKFKYKADQTGARHQLNIPGFT